MSAIVKPALSTTLAQSQYRQILGIQFFTGTTKEAVELMQNGGLLVVPAAPALKDLPTHAAYREALLGADLTITDSAFMVLAWNILQRDDIPRVSGLAYMRRLLTQPDFRRPGNSFWIMPSASSSARNLQWLAKHHDIKVNDDHAYLAPMYGETIEDEELLTRLNRLRPQHVVIGIGGGTQERLGLYLKNNLDYLPAIHCTGAAIGFLSGDQVNIPVWADKLFVGWLLRCLWEPKRYVSRYWNARKLLPLILKYRERLPLAEV